MHLLRLELKNYRQFQDTTIEFADGVTGIIGQNGAGKSTLVEAIAFALYGTNATRTVKENIKREKAAPSEDVAVTLEWEMHGDRYGVTRRLRGERLIPDVQFTVNGILAAHSAKAVQPAIEKTVGLDWQAFYASFFARQKELNALSDLQTSARKELVVRMLRIDAVDTALERVKTEARELKLRREFLSKSVQELPVLQTKLQLKKEERERALAALTPLEKEVQSFSQSYAALQERYAQGKQRATTFQQKEQQRTQCAQRIEREEQRLHDIDTEIAKLSFDQTAHEQNITERAALRKKAEALNSEREAVRIEKNKQETSCELLRRKFIDLDKKEKDIKALGPDALCPTCRRPLAGEFSEITAHFQEEKDAIQKEGTHSAEKIAALAAQEKDLNAQLAAAQKNVQDLEAAIQHGIALQSRKDLLERTREQTRTELRTLTPHQALLAQELAALAFDSAQFQKLEKEHARAVEQQYQLKERLQQQRFAVSLIDKDLEHLTAQCDKGAAAENELTGITTEHEDAHALIGLFTEFRTHLISKIRPTLSAIAGRLFIDMTQGKYTGFSLDEDYEIWLEEDGKPFKLERFSGGEIDVANLCLRLAIAQYVAEQHDTETGFIVLDEIFGSQDGLRKQAILSALSELTKRFRQILLITHVDEVKESVAQVLNIVENEEGLSHVEA